MIDIVIFSKDRAMQLELLLRSIRDNFKEIKKVNIICTGSNEEYIKGYMKLMKMYRQHNWIAEKNLIEDVKTVINNFNEKFAMTLVDDEIVIRNHSVQTMLPILEDNEDIHCASLRLGMNIGNYCYTADVKADIPEFEIMSKSWSNKDGSNIYKWDWTKGDGRVDWYYPSCINSNIYRTEFLKDWVNNISFGNINDLEGTLNQNRNTFKHYMICMDKSKTINIANNLTQSGYNRHSDKTEFTLEELNKKFLGDYVIDEKDFYNVDNDIATFEKDYRLIKW
jgi:hypothetical protein